jgi:hypothetical protein
MCVCVCVCVCLFCFVLFCFVLFFFCFFPLPPLGISEEKFQEKSTLKLELLAFDNMNECRFGFIFHYS